MTFVANCRDIFFPVPFPPSPFAFRRLMGCFAVDFQEGKRPLRAKTGKRPIKVGKRPIKEVKRPIKAMVLVGISVGCLMGCFRAPPPWCKTAPLKRLIIGFKIGKTGFRSQKNPISYHLRRGRFESEDLAEFCGKTGHEKSAQGFLV